jgi:hypothetical protein
LGQAEFTDVHVRSSARCADENFAASAAPRGDHAPIDGATRPGLRHRLLDAIERVGVVAGVDWGEELVAEARRAPASR